MSYLNIDHEKCIACGICVKDCVANALELENEKLSCDAEKCIKCDHCFAICPKNAISTENNQHNIKIAGASSPAAMEALIKGRRSCRQYKQANVQPEILEKLKDILATSPTGVNAQALRFTFIDDIELMAQVRNETYKELRSADDAGKIPEQFHRFVDMIDLWEEKQIDIIFRNAPHLLIVSNVDDAPCADVDHHIALSYFDLYANSLGLGTTWCGLGKYAMLDICAGMKERLKIPENHNNAYVMLFGLPAVKYQRIVERHSDNFVSIKSLDC